MARITNPTVESLRYSVKSSIYFAVLFEQLYFLRRRTGIFPKAVKQPQGMGLGAQFICGLKSLQHFVYVGA
jgi:hypothetical protein